MKEFIVPTKPDQHRMQKIEKKYYDTFIIHITSVLDFLKSKSIYIDFFHVSDEDASVMFEFHNKGIYHLLELFSDNDAIFLIRNVEAVSVWDLTLDNYMTKLEMEFS